MGLSRAADREVIGELVEEAQLSLNLWAWWEVGNSQRPWPRQGLTTLSHGAQCKLVSVCLLSVLCLCFCTVKKKMKWVLYFWKDMGALRNRVDPTCCLAGGLNFHILWECSHYRCSSRWSGPHGAAGHRHHTRGWASWRDKESGHQISIKWSFWWDECQVNKRGRLVQTSQVYAHGD